MKFNPENNPEQEIRRDLPDIDAFVRAYTNSENFANLSQRSGDSPKLLAARRKEINRFSLDRDLQITPSGISEVYYPDQVGSTVKMRLGHDKGDWPSYSNIVAHEYGHLGFNDGSLSMSPQTQAEIQSRNEWWTRAQSMSPSDAVKDRMAIDNISKREAKSRLEHDLDPNETRADLVQLRYQLQKAGIYDSVKGGEFTKEHWDKMNAAGIKNRLNRLFKGRNIVWLMNNIAQNNSSTPGLIQMAKEGDKLQPKKYNYGKSETPSEWEKQYGTIAPEVEITGTSTHRELSPAQQEALNKYHALYKRQEEYMNPNTGALIPYDKNMFGRLYSSYQKLPPGVQNLLEFTNPYTGLIPTVLNAGTAMSEAVKNPSIETVGSAILNTALAGTYGGSIVRSAIKVVPKVYPAAIALSKNIQYGSLSGKSLYHNILSGNLPKDSRSHNLFRNGATRDDSQRLLNDIKSWIDDLPPGGKFEERSLSSDSYPIVLSRGLRAKKNKEAKVVFTNSYNRLNYAGTLTPEEMQLQDQLANLGEDLPFEQLQLTPEWEAFAEAITNRLNNKTAELSRLYKTPIPPVKIIGRRIYVPDIKIIKNDPYSLATKLERIFSPTSRNIVDFEEDDVVQAGLKSMNANNLDNILPKSKEQLETNITHNFYNLMGIPIRRSRHRPSRPRR